MDENKKFVINREKVKKALGLVGSFGMSYVMGAIVGTFGPRNKLGKFACVLGAWGLSLKVNPIIEDGVGEGVDVITDMIDAIKENVVIKKEPDLKIIEED